MFSDTIPVNNRNAHPNCIFSAYLKSLKKCYLFFYTQVQMPQNTSVNHPPSAQLMNSETLPSKKEAQHGMTTLKIITTIHL